MPSKGPNVTKAVRRRLSVGGKSVLGKRSPDLEKASSKDPLLNPKGTAKDEKPRYVPTDWDDSLPYGGKVYLARKKKPESLISIILQICIVIGAVSLMYYGWYHTEHLHFHATKLYASLGQKDAQALIGHKFLHGKGVEKNHTMAMEWLYEAAKQGHPHASYNVAVGHLQGIKTALKPGEAKMLIQHAAENGVEEAIDTLDRICSKGKCDF